jgi:hypothetical protein
MDNHNHNHNQTHNMNQILKEQLIDASCRVDIYKTELKECNINDIDADELIELCIESNFQAIHDILLNECYFEYNQWMKENICNNGNNNSYCVWLKKIRNEEDEEYLCRYNRRMKKFKI